MKIYRVSTMSLALLLFVSCQEHISENSKSTVVSHSFDESNAGSRVVTSNFQRSKQSMVSNKSNTSPIGIPLPPPPGFLSERDRNIAAPIQDNQLKVPLFVPNNLTNDGRLAFDIEAGGTIKLYTVSPETLHLQGKSLNHSAPGMAMYANGGRFAGGINMSSVTYSSSQSNPLPPNLVGWSVGGHYGICDPGMENAEQRSNPYRCDSNSNYSAYGTFDCYNLDIIVPLVKKQPIKELFPDYWKEDFWQRHGRRQPFISKTYPHEAGNESTFFYMPVSFKLSSFRILAIVENPKTTNAKIRQLKQVNFDSGEECPKFRGNEIDKNTPGCVRQTREIRSELVDNLLFYDDGVTDSEGERWPEPSGGWRNAAGMGTYGLKMGIASSLFEPIFTGDGRLFISRISGSPITWDLNDRTINDGRSNVSVFGRKNYDTVYAVIPENEPACDITKLVSASKKTWQPFRPLTYAPEDPEVKNRYGFAAKPFKDSLGNPLPADFELELSYPWIDKAGNNIALTTLYTPPLFNQDGVTRSQYETSCVAGVTRADCERFGLSTIMKASKKLGVAIIGAWTNGKLILLDGAINNSDLALNKGDLFSREMKLYASDDRIRVGGTIAQGSMLFNGDGFNVNLIQSPENLFNYVELARPISPFDVVWHLGTGRGTSEVVFDPYLDPHTLIYSDMTGALELKKHSSAGVTQWARIEYKDGITFNYINDLQRDLSDLKVQNAATGLGGKFAPPKAGIPEGNIRIEPVALGGYRGKGLYLDGSSRVNYFVDSTGNSEIGKHSWSFSLFFDSRQSSNQAGTLIELPSSKIQVIGKDKIRLVFKNKTTRDILIPMGASFTWNHLTLTNENTNDRGKKKLKLYLNGMLVLEEYPNEDSSSESFVFEADNHITLGASTSGFQGWVDEFKVVARTYNPEEACNQAYGTLAKVELMAAPEYQERASAYNKFSTHSMIRKSLNYQIDHSNNFEVALVAKDSKYLCVTDLNSSLGVSVHKLPPGLSKLREYFIHRFRDPSKEQEACGNLVKEKIVYNQPRTDSSNSPFCLSCHAEGGNDFSPDYSGSLHNKLGMPALMPENVNSGLSDLASRQPTQPPRLVHGVPPQVLMVQSGLKGVIPWEAKEGDAMRVDFFLNRKPNHDPSYRVGPVDKSTYCNYEDLPFPGETPVPRKASTLNSPDTVKFSPTLESKVSSQRITIAQAVGSRPVRIKAEDISLTGNDFRVDSLSRSRCVQNLEDGKNCEIIILFAPRSSGIKSSSLVVRYNNGLSSSAMTVTMITGQAIRPPSPSSLSAVSRLPFGSVQVSRTGYQNLTLTQKRGDRMVTGVKIYVSSTTTEFILTSQEMNACLRNLSAGNSCSLRMNFSPRSIGLKTGELVIEYKDGVRIAPIKLNIRLEGVGVRNQSVPCKGNLCL